MLAVGGGGALGALSRFLLSTYVQRYAEMFPLGTLTVNLLGALCIGVIAGILPPRGDSVFVFFALTGFLGSFTTFSTYSLELLRLLDQHRYLLAMSYFALSNGLSLVLVLLGLWCGRSFRGAIQ
ncbi:MAG: fluoride efflux transporter CrcB [Spirochaetales bacterium]|nr:fluoride efflux transporter CrcB [Spirochaetales bacterium]